MTAPEVHSWAEERYRAWLMEDEVTNEILARLDLLNMNLITTEDIPAYLEALDVAPQAVDEAREILQRQEQSVDFDERVESLRADPFYSPYCD